MQDRHAKTTKTAACRLAAAGMAGLLVAGYSTEPYRIETATNPP